MNFEVKVDPLGGMKYSTQLQTPLRSYKRTICHRRSDGISRVPRQYAHYYLKVPIKDTTTLPLR